MTEPPLPFGNVPPPPGSYPPPPPGTYPPPPPGSYPPPPPGNYPPPPAGYYPAPGAYPPAGYYPPVTGHEGYRNCLEGVRRYPAFQSEDTLEWILGKTAARVWGFQELK